MAYLNSDDLLLPGPSLTSRRTSPRIPRSTSSTAIVVIIDENDGQVGDAGAAAHTMTRSSTVLDFVPQETLFWRRSAWEAAGGRIDASLRFALDWDLLLRLRDSGARWCGCRASSGAFRTMRSRRR